MVKSEVDTDAEGAGDWDGAVGNSGGCSITGEEARGDARGVVNSASSDSGDVGASDGGEGGRGASGTEREGLGGRSEEDLSIALKDDLGGERRRGQEETSTHLAVAAGSVLVLAVRRTKEAESADEAEAESGRLPLSEVGRSA